MLVRISALRPKDHLDDPSLTRRCSAYLSSKPELDTLLDTHGRAARMCSIEGASEEERHLDADFNAWSIGPCEAVLFTPHPSHFSIHPRTKRPLQHEQATTAVPHSVQHVHWTCRQLPAFHQNSTGLQITPSYSPNLNRLPVAW